MDRTGQLTRPNMPINAVVLIKRIEVLLVMSFKNV